MKPLSSGKQLAHKAGAGGLYIPWYWAAPAILFALSIRYITVIAGGWYAFTDWNGISLRANYIGLANFIKVFSQPIGKQPMITTLKYALCIILFSNLIGIIFACLLDRGMRLRFVTRVMIFIPVIMLPMAVSYTWKFIFQYKGPLNGVLQSLGILDKGITWLAHPTLSFWAIVAVVVWRWAGRCMIIYLAGLQNISDDVREAAIIDGASPLQQFFSITFPLLAPSMTITFTLTLTAGLNIFDEVMALTAGGPAGLTESMATQIYTQTYVYGNFGYGAALSLILTVFVTAAALIQLQTLRRREREMS